ncbi:MAG: hypothetical protein V3R94_09600 [Acidobacteriota bacterium]
MKKLTVPALVVLIILIGGSTGLARYRIKDLYIKPAEDYGAHQDFQNVIIGAYPYGTQGSTLELFDTETLHRRHILPVLVVVENYNDFAIRIHEQDVVLITQDGLRFPSLPYQVVLLHISNQPLTTDSTQPESLRRIVGKEMAMDFENKAFGEKQIAPGNSDFGVVFFWLPEIGNLPGSRLYLPDIVNLSEGEQLMSFEFELGRPQE